MWRGRWDARPGGPELTDDDFNSGRVRVGAHVRVTPGLVQQIEEVEGQEGIIISLTDLITSQPINIPSNTPTQKQQLILPILFIAGIWLSHALGAVHHHGESLRTISQAGMGFALIIHRLLSKRLSLKNNLTLFSA